MTGSRALCRWSGTRKTVSSRQHPIILRTSSKDDVNQGLGHSQTPENHTKNTTIPNHLVTIINSNRQHQTLNSTPTPPHLLPQFRGTGLFAEPCELVATTSISSAASSAVLGAPLFMPPSQASAGGSARGSSRVPVSLSRVYRVLLEFRGSGFRIRRSDAQGSGRRSCVPGSKHNQQQDVGRSKSAVRLWGGGGVSNTAKDGLKVEEAGSRIYIYIHRHTHTHTHIYIYIYSGAQYTHTHTYIYIYIYMCVCVCVYV